MVRRLFLTPSELPEGSICRPLEMPDSRDWLGVFSEALSQTIYAYNYEQIDPGDLTPDQAAEAAYSVYTTWLEAVCGAIECPPMVLPDTGGRLWRQNPSTEHWEYLTDDLTEWVEPTGDDAIAPPEPREELTDEEKLCNAAANAVNLYYTLWLSILDAWNNDIEPQAALAAIAVTTGLYLGGTYYPPIAAIGALVEKAFEAFFFTFEVITEQTWNAQFLEEMTCIFLSNATLQADDTVTFSFDGVITSLNATFWTGTQSFLQVMQSTYLISLLGPQALNRAGGLTAVTGDCAGCGTWCREFDFSHGQDGFSPLASEAAWNIGGWWNSISGSGRTVCNITLSPTIGGTVSLKRAIVEFYIAAIPAPPLGYHQLEFNSLTVLLPQQTGYTTYDTGYTLNGSGTTGSLRLRIYDGGTITTYRWHKLTLWGTGVDPFGPTQGRAITA